MLKGVKTETPLTRFAKPFLAAAVVTRILSIICVVASVGARA